MKYVFACVASLLAACSAPDRPATTAPHPVATAAAPVRPDTAAVYQFLRQTTPMSFRDHHDVRGGPSAYFLRYPYGLGSMVTEHLTGPDTGPSQLGNRFYRTPAAVLREFRQQLQHLDTAALRRWEWQPAHLPRLVLVRGYNDTLPASLAASAPPRQRPRIGQAVRTWNRTPHDERFMEYASVPLFTADSRYALVVRGQSQPSVGWDSIFVYERTATGWKIIDASPLTTI